MPGSAIGKQMNYGYPGNVSRSVDAIITNRFVKSTDTDNIAFGDPVVLNTDNTYSKFGASGTAALFAGVAVREVKQATDYFSTTGEYLPGEPCDVIERGSVAVVCTEGTPTAGGDVYVVTVAGAGAVSAVGNFVATSTPAGTSSAAVKITNAKWKTGLQDANKVTELTITTRNNP